MGSYIINFTVYTMAMLGLIFFAIFVYKKFMEGGLNNKSSKFLNIEETMNINPRKSLLVVRAGSERFLIASDIDRTTLLSKLDNNSSLQPIKNFERFENIIKEETPQNLNELYPPEQKRVIDMNIVQDKKEQIHLEPIKQKNPQASQLRRGMDRREPYKSKEQISNKQVTLDFNNSTNHGLTTIREMAKKINEL